MAREVGAQGITVNTVMPKNVMRGLIDEHRALLVAISNDMSFDRCVAIADLIDQFSQGSISFRVLRKRVCKTLWRTINEPNSHTDRYNNFGGCRLIIPFPE